MGLSIYYAAKRTLSITEEEKKGVLEIVNRYCNGYPFKERGEDFGLYGFNDTKNTILCGATKLPSMIDDGETWFKIANYWLRCLTEMTYYLKGAQWEVCFEEVELIFEKGQGWRFPNDEEYEKQQNEYNGRE